MSLGPIGASLAALKIDQSALEALPPAERALVADDLRALEEQYRENPLLGYHPHGRQVEFHEPLHGEDGPFWPPLRAFFGGNRSGKTTGAMCDTIIQAVDADVVPDHLKAFKRWEPPFKCRIMTPDFGDTHEVVLEKIREWCPKGQLKGGSFDRAFDKQKRVLWFKNGSRFHFNSNVQEREQLGGSDLHRVVYDEEPRQDLRTESLTRLIDHDGEEIFAMTPLEGMSWLFEEVYELWEREELAPEDGRVLVVDMDDNPHISDSGKARALAAYPEWEREARKTGRFVSFAGLIYPMWSPQKHVIPAIDRVPAGVEVFRAVDPGYRHMCAVLYCYLDHDDTLVVFDEIAAKAKTVKQVCDEMSLYNSKWGVERDDGKRFPLSVNWTVIDPAARNKNNQTGRSDQAEFSDNGVPTIPGQNAVGAGINRVKERLDADRLRVCANCTELIGEFRKYRWVKDTKRTEDEAPSRPVKKNDHLLDALRYVVMQRPLVPEHEAPRETDTMKDRLLRHHLRRLRTPKRLPDSGMGPGQFA